jgi:hypothetical protein
MQLLCHQLDDPAGTKSALASPHAGSRPALDTIQRTGRNRAVKRVDDFAFGYRFTAANDAPVARIFFYQRIFSASDSLFIRTTFLSSEKSAFGLSRRPVFRSKRTISGAIAAAQVSPGDFIPARLKNP